MPGQDLRTRVARRTWAVLFALIASALVAGACWYYRNAAGQVRQEKYYEIAAIAELKAGQILRWRRERLADAERVAKSPFFRKATAEFLRDPATPGLRADLLERLKLERMVDVYADVLLLAPDGKVLLADKENPEPISPAMEPVIAASLADRKTVLCGFCRCPDGTIYLDAVAPVLDADGHPLAVIVLRSDAANFLYPLIQSWPTPSRSAETLLVRREGEEVVFLNELRHRAETALSLREPLTRPDLPAVQAVLGKQGMFEGKDYRGVNVLADLRPLPGTPWFMVAKIDTDEILAEAYYRAGMMALFVVLFILLAAAATALAFRRRQAGLYRDLYRSEREQREALEEFRTTLYSIGDAVITTDKESLVREMNPVAEQLTGWSRAEAQGKPLVEVFRIINEETHATVENPVERVLREGVVGGLANHSVLIARDGTERPVADSGAPIRNESGSVIGVVLVFRDQTEERAAQTALLQSEAKYRNLAESSDEVIYRADPETFATTYVNSAVERIYGYTVEEWLRDPALWGRTIYPEDKERVLALFTEAQRTMGSVVVEYRIIRKDKTVRWVEEHVSWGKDEQGNAVSLNGVLDDITERKRVEEALARSAAIVQAVFEGASDGILAADVETRKFVVANEAMCRMLGYSHDEIMTLGMQDIHPAEDLARIMEQFDRQVRGKISLVADIPLRRKDGAVLYTDINSTPVELVGRPCLIGIFRDITERKQAEEARAKLEAQLRQAQKMETVGRLAGGVAHDFNNVLTGIIGYAEFAHDKLSENAPVREYIAQVISLARRAAGITQQLLAFARRQTLQLAVCNINTSLGSLDELLRPLIGEDIDLKFFPAPDLGNVRADAGQIEQVLMNLAVNARDAMPDGGKLTVETANASLDQTYADARPEVQPGEYVMIAVTDTGVGMDEATRARVFEPFFTTKDMGKGTGLGLATAYGIVKQHGGYIYTYSEPGKGTCFKIYLPRVPDAVDEATPSAAEPIAERGEGVVLVVDDEASICDVVARALIEEGYEVVVAASPGEAQEQFAARQQEIQLLLTDVVLPGANGRELYEQCVKLKPSLRVLYMSGYTDNAIVHRGVLDAGIAFIRKPFTTSELLRKVSQVLAS